MQHFVSITYRRQAADSILAYGEIKYGGTTMAKRNLLLEYSEKLAVDIAKLCGRLRRMLTASCITIEPKLKQG